VSNVVLSKKSNGHKLSEFRKKPAENWVSSLFSIAMKSLATAKTVTRKALANFKMSKKEKKLKAATTSQPKAPVTPVAPPVSKRGWRRIGIGIAVLTIGYIVLSMADPMGQNWASNLSTFLIISGYALIGVGILTKDKNPNI
jgi:hypothetical protein